MQREDPAVFIRERLRQGRLEPTLRPLLRYALRMTIHALHPVDVVPALRLAERGIHLLHIQPAVRQPGMAVGARRARLLSVLLMTRQATDALVDPHSSAVVPGPHLGARLRRVALVAE